MDIDATLAADACPLPARPLRQRLGAALARLAPPVLVVLLALSAWQVRQAAPYTPASGFGYGLGVVGGSLMLALLTYPVRKRLRFLQVLGPLKHWFRFHLMAGILGPLFILYHSTFHVGSFNAAVALSSMLLVVGSGIVGRFLYRRIHHGLYGSRATLQELQKAAAERLEALQPALAAMPAIRGEMERFAALAARQPAGRWQRAGHFLALGAWRLLAARRVRRALAAGGAAASRADLESLAAVLDATLRAGQKSAQFATYERLFSLWHVIHIPFLWMLLFTAIIHVVAVHAY